MKNLASYYVNVRFSDSDKHYLYGVVEDEIFKLEPGDYCIVKTNHPDIPYKVVEVMTVVISPPGVSFEIKNIHSSPKELRIVSNIREDDLI